MTEADQDPASGATEYLSDQLVALEQRIFSANSPGKLEGLLAYHILVGTSVGFEWNVNPITKQWLEANADRLTDAPRLAALGYGLTHFIPRDNREATDHLIAGLNRLMLRDPFPQDGVTFLRNPLQLIGVALASIIVRDDLPDLQEWLLDVMGDPRLIADSARQLLVRDHVRGMLAGEPTVLRPPGPNNLADLALMHWMTTSGTARVAEPHVDLPLAQRRILSELMRTSAAALSAPEAAWLRCAAGQIIDASIDATVLNRNYVSVVLRRFEVALRRWRWDDRNRVNDPIQWPIKSEREVQDILWIILRPVFDDLVDEETLPKVGHSSYRADFGLPRLGILIEVKYVRTAAEFKKIEKEVMEDTIAYLKKATIYKKIIVFIYDESSSVQEHDTTDALLRSFDNVVDVIIVSRPSQLATSSTASASPTGPTKLNRRRPADGT